MGDGGGNQPPFGGGPHNPQENSGATLGASATNNENTSTSTSCATMYTYQGELLGPCGRGGAGPYSEYTVTEFSNKFIQTMRSTGRGIF